MLYASSALDAIYFPRKLLSCFVFDAYASTYTAFSVANYHIWFAYFFCYFSRGCMSIFIGKIQTSHTTWKTCRRNDFHTLIIKTNGGDIFSKHLNIAALKSRRTKEQKTIVLCFFLFAAVHMGISSVQCTFFACLHFHWFPKNLRSRRYRSRSSFYHYFGTEWWLQAWMPNSKYVLERWIWLMAAVFENFAHFLAHKHWTLWIPDYAHESRHYIKCDINGCKQRKKSTKGRRKGMKAVKCNLLPNISVHRDVAQPNVIKKYAYARAQQFPLPIQLIPFSRRLFRRGSFHIFGKESERKKACSFAWDE